jgi:hypothetical protein
MEKSSGHCSVAAYSGKLPLSFGFNVSETASRPSWIIDSGATDHMTPSSKQFSTYSPCPSNKKIATADGTLVTVAGIGDIQINHFITLKRVLHVPKLFVNLISIQKLTSDLSCSVTFQNDCCILKDKESGKSIEHAKEWNGLYYLEKPCQPLFSLVYVKVSTH